VQEPVVEVSAAFVADAESFAYNDQSPTPTSVMDLQTHKTRRQPVLGGLINKYQRAA
jgi:hypothetical protein